MKIFVNFNVDKSKMDIQTKKLNFIQEVLSLSDERIIDKLDFLLKKEKREEKLDPEIMDEMTSRVLKAEEDVKEGRTYDRKEAEALLRSRLGL
jgi:hypothetical protein